MIDCIVAANAPVRRIVRQPVRRLRRRLVGFGRAAPLCHRVAQLCVDKDEIDDLVLRAEGRGAVLLGQLAEKLDDVATAYAINAVSSVAAIACSFLEDL